MKRTRDIYPMTNRTFTMAVTVTFVMEDEANALNHYDVGKLMNDFNDSMGEAISQTLEDAALALEDGGRVHKIDTVVTIPIERTA